MPLQEDTYYRGYRLVEFPIMETVQVYNGPDHIDTFPTKQIAMDTIDEWITGRRS